MQGSPFEPTGRPPTSRRRLARALGLACAALLASACVPTAPPSLRLAWRFADGRRCADTGAARVTVRAVEPDESAPLACAAAGCSFPCESGEADTGAAVEIGLPTGARDDLELELRAESPMGAILYRGMITPGMREPDAGLAEVVLRFVGGGG